MQELESEFQCSECGADIVEGVRVCPECHTPLEWNEATSMRSTSRRICLVCARTVAEEQSICPHCGSPLSSTSFTGRYESTRRLANWAVTLLAISACFWVWSVYTGYQDLKVLQRVIDGVPHAVDEFGSSNSGFLSLLEAVVQIGSGIVFLVWINCVYKNLIAFGLKDLRFTPGAAVFRFFIPFVNFIHPHQVLSELWKSSDPDNLNPESWKTERGNSIITFFTASLLVNIAVWIWLIRLTVKAGLALDQKLAMQSLLEACWWMLLASALVATTEVLTVLLVNSIQKRLDAKAISLLRQVNSPQ